MKLFPKAHSWGIGLCLLSLVLVFSFTLINPSGKVQAASLSDSAQSTQMMNLNSIDAAMSAIYQQYGSLTKITDPGDVFAFRWLAMARVYVAQGM